MVYEFDGGQIWYPNNLCHEWNEIIIGHFWLLSDNINSKSIIVESVQDGKYKSWAIGASASVRRLEANIEW